MRSDGWMRCVQQFMRTDPMHVVRRSHRTKRAAGCAGCSTGTCSMTVANNVSHHRPMPIARTDGGEPSVGRHLAELLPSRPSLMLLLLLLVDCWSLLLVTRGVCACRQQRCCALPVRLAAGRTASDQGAVPSAAMMQYSIGTRAAANERWRTGGRCRRRAARYERVQSMVPRSRPIEGCRLQSSSRMAGRPGSTEW